MQTLNDSVVESIYSDLYNQFTVLGSPNETINTIRHLFFQKRCNQLNDFVVVPESYCKFYWDGIACWNATPADTIVRSQCVSWPMNNPPPQNAFVERRCLDGTWENISTRTLEMLYNNCKIPPEPIIDNSLEDSLNMGTRYIALTGYCSSAFALLFAISVFILLKKLKCGRNWIHFNLFISFFLRFIFCGLEVMHAFWRDDPTKDCLEFNFFDETFGEKLFILAWNYIIITSYFWVFIEGFYLHNSIYFNVFHESSTIPYIILGWVTPFFIIAAFGVSKALLDNTRYWIAHCDERIFWIIRGPLVVIALAEFIITINIIRQLYSKVQNDRYLNERDRYRKFARSFLYLLLSVGGTYFIFDILLYSTSLFDETKKIELMVHRIYAIVNSLWGIVISYIYCFNNADIRREIRHKLRKIKQNLTNFGRTQSNGNETCSKHSKSPLLSLSNNGQIACSECAINRKLLELNTFSKSPPDTACTNTICSTTVNSEPNTLHKIQQRVYPRVTYLSFCREEGSDEIVETQEHDL